MRLAPVVAVLVVACAHAVPPAGPVVARPLPTLIPRHPLRLLQADTSKAFEVNALGTWSIVADTVLVHFDTIRIVRRADGRRGAHIFALELFLMTVGPGAREIGSGGLLVRDSVATPDGQEALLTAIDLSATVSGPSIDWSAYWLDLRLGEEWDQSGASNEYYQTWFQVEGPRDIFRGVAPRER